MPTILCIDDHLPTLQTLCWLFEANGYRCLSASSAQGGREIYLENEVDLVVMDRSLESEDGSALAAEFKKIRPAPILMLSGWTELDKPSPVDVLLIKPQQPKDLLAVVLSLIVRTQTASV